MTHAYARKQTHMVYTSKYMSAQTYMHTCTHAHTHTSYDAFKYMPKPTWTHTHTGYTHSISSPATNNSNVRLTIFTTLLMMPVIMVGLTIP